MYSLPIRLKKTLCLLTLAAFVPTSGAFAATANEETVNITTHYINGATGNEILDSETDKVSKELKNTIEIDGYTYRNYKEKIDYVYQPTCIPYIVGYPDKTVRPMRDITRAEAVAVFYRLYDGKYPKETKNWITPPFNDVDSNEWYYDSVKQMYKSGLINGDNGNFRPNDPITRAELTSLAVKFSPKDFNNVPDTFGSFTDAPKGQWYSESVAAAASDNLVAGYPDGTFKPNDFITRAETMAVINRVLDRQITEEKLSELGVTNPYTDIKKGDWYYANAIEATVKHTKERKEWHNLTYNNGNVDTLYEEYVDEDGNELSPAIASSINEEYRKPKEITGFEYVGKIRTITYVYDKDEEDDQFPILNNSRDTTRPDYPGTIDIDQPNEPEVPPVINEPGNQKEELELELASLRRQGIEPLESSMTDYLQLFNQKPDNMVLVEFSFDDSKYFSLLPTKFYVPKNKKVRLRVPDLYNKTGKLLNRSDWETRIIDDWYTEQSFSEDTIIYNKEIPVISGFTLATPKEGFSFIEVEKDTLDPGSTGYLIIKRDGEEYLFKAKSRTTEIKMGNKHIRQTLFGFDIKEELGEIIKGDLLKAFVIKDNLRSPEWEKTI